MPDQPANDAQYIADAVVELRDQQFLPRIGLMPLGGCFVGQPQHHFDQRGAQCLCNPQFCRREGRAMPLHLFQPFGETLARGQARPVGSIFDGLVRVSGPTHRAFYLFAKQDDIIPGRTRNRYGEHAGCVVSEGLGILDQFTDTVGREYLAAGRTIQRADDPAEIFGGRGMTGKGIATVDPDADAIGRYRAGEDVGEPVGIVEQGIAGRHRTQQLVGNLARAPFILHQIAPLTAFETHREHLRKQLAERPALKTGGEGRIMVAGKQAPQLVLHDDRNRQRPLHTHVPEIFDMDGRNRAQDGK